MQFYSSTTLSAIADTGNVALLTAAGSTEFNSLTTAATDMAAVTNYFTSSVTSDACQDAVDGALGTARFKI